MRAGVHAIDTVSPIPLTVVGGPAGAGKSAVIRHLMEDQVGRRVVVIVPQLVGSTSGATSVHEHEHALRMDRRLHDAAEP